MATRSRKGYWRMSQNEIVRFALNNRWLEEQGVPDMGAIWIVLHYRASPKLIGTALYGAVRRVVWDPGANYSRDPILLLELYVADLEDLHEDNSACE